MLIPRGILKLRQVAAQEKTRYAMSGVRFDRDTATGEAIAVATDGKRLLECRWDDSADRSEFPQVEGFDLGAPKSPNACIVPNEALAAQEKAVPRKGLPRTRFLALEEPTANGTIKLATTGTMGASVSSVPSVEGHFPPYLDVLPPEAGYATFRVGLNAGMLADLAEALNSARGHEKAPPLVVLEFKDANSAIIVKPMGANLSGVKTRACIMPIVCEEKGAERPQATGSPEASADTTAQVEALREALKEANEGRRKATEELESVRTQLATLKASIQALL